ncbi:MAG: phosphatidylglycerophosphatase A [Proteobacteria bacterium]|nr:phosphatidylglycerophosphatase A [Desulfobulbaceae bacterium]MBU4151950.1 phosphatidylglycerophosphatase A [Pseudomonadota bacterium]MDP2104393.1 phosphatidylglycerophosphatase A [Desulfobulbaceae bacterium]
MVRIILFIATGGYAGYLPKAPGTWGTLVALPINFLLLYLSPEQYYTALAVIFFLAVYTAGSAEKIMDRKDPGSIVIDEIIGMLIALIAVPAQPLYWAVAFLLFRFFDIIKPWPVSWADRHLNGGLGIVMDDVLAGIYAWLALHGALLLLPMLSGG